MEYKVTREKEQSKIFAFLKENFMALKTAILGYNENINEEIMPPELKKSLEKVEKIEKNYRDTIKVESNKANKITNKNLNKNKNVKEKVKNNEKEENERV